MELDWTQIVIAVVISIIGSNGITALINARASKTKDNATAKKDDALAYSEVMQSQSLLMKDLEDQRVARNKEREESEQLRKEDKEEFEETIKILRAKFESDLAEVKAKFTLDLASLQNKYDLLEKRFAELDAVRGQLLQENWELKRKEGKDNE